MQRKSTKIGITNEIAIVHLEHYTQQNAGINKVKECEATKERNKGL